MHAWSEYSRLIDLREGISSSTHSNVLTTRTCHVRNRPPACCWRYIDCMQVSISSIIIADIKTWVWDPMIYTGKFWARSGIRYSGVRAQWLHQIHSSGLIVSMANRLPPIWYYFTMKVCFSRDKELEVGPSEKGVETGRDWSFNHDFVSWIIILALHINQRKATKLRFVEPIESDLATCMCMPWLELHLPLIHNVT